MIKSRTELRGHVARREEKWLQFFFVGSLKERDNLEDLGADR